MDKKTIEYFAANAVEASILDTDILHPVLSRNDKDLSWDGFIEVYKSNDKEKKANLSGRVPVQVKGTENNNHSKAITFPAETADLRNYLQDKGVIYFVVRIHKADPSKKKIYYASLPPVKLKQYLNGAEKQKTKTIKLTEFPPEKDEKTSIVVSFLRHSTKQLSYVDTGFIPLEEIQAGKHDYKIQFTGYGKQADDPLFSAILGKETYAYVTIDGNRAEIPVDTPLTVHEMRSRVNGRTCIWDKCYYEDYERIITQEGISLKIGDSLTMALGKFENTTGKASVTFSPFLRKAIKDMQFIVDAVDAGSFYIDAIQLGFSSFDAGTPNFISDTRKDMAFLKRIIELFNILNVTDDLNMEELTAEERRHIKLLLKAFVDQKEISDVAEENPVSILNLKISNLDFRLVLIKNENGTHTIQDFFNSTVAVRYRNAKEDYLITSPYSVLSTNDYLTVANINYSMILESYKNLLPLNPNIFERANLDMLQMLLAYDKSLNKKQLTTAKDIVKWILDDGDTIGKNIKILNYLQIIKRERAINKDEVRQLCEIVEDPNASQQEKIGAYLLQDNQTSAEIHFEKLTPKEQTDFKTFPIFRFYQQEKMPATV